RAERENQKIWLSEAELIHELHRLPSEHGRRARAVDSHRVEHHPGLLVLSESTQHLRIAAIVMHGKGLISAQPKGAGQDVSSGHPRFRRSLKAPLRLRRVRRGMRNCYFWLRRSALARRQMKRSLADPYLELRSWR